MKKRFVNLERTDENVADQYPDIFDGLQKDAIQNAWDARLTKKGKDWRVAFKYNPSHKVFIIEDFGTTGMNEERWERYQGLWHTEKVEDVGATGSRGQGKFLFHYFSKDKIVLTETLDEKGIYRFSYGTTQEYDDNDKKLEDFISDIPNLNHQGTRIFIFNIKDELKSGLLNEERFLNLISASWWEIIQNYGATISVNFNGVEKIVVIPQLPPNIKKEKYYRDEEIAKFGKVRNLVLRFYDSEVPVLFQGVAVQRAGMTILRIPVRADETLKKRIYGHCNFDDQFESELKKCELPNHMGFTIKRAWTHAREFIEYKLESFTLEISPKKEKIAADRQILDEAVKLVNKLIYEYAPELSEGETAPGGQKNKSGGQITTSKPKIPIRIGSFSPNERKIEYGATLVIDCGVINETSNKEDLTLNIKIYHEKSGTKKYTQKFDFELVGLTRKTINIPLLDFDKKADVPGKYVGEAILKYRATSEEIDIKRFIFYVHGDPPKGKAFVSQFVPVLGRGQFFERWRNLPRNEKGVVHIVWDHPEFVRLREQARIKSRKVEGKEVMLYCTKCGADEAMRRLLEIRHNEKKLTPDELKEIRRIHNELHYAINISIF